MYQNKPHYMYLLSLFVLMLLNNTVYTQTNININDGQYLLRHLPAEQYDNLGNSICSGDINGDGFSDLILGTERYHSAPSRIYVTFGSKTVAKIKDFSVTKPDLLIQVEGGDFQETYQATGDINGDNMDDLLIGAPYALGRSGQLFVIYGQDDFPDTLNIDESNADITIKGSDDFFVYELGIKSIIRDINTDGYGDIITYARQGRIETGRIHIFYGGNNMPAMIDLSGIDQSDVLIIGENSFQTFGNDFDIGDIDGDKLLDLVILDPKAISMSTSFKGKLYCFLGKNNFRKNVIDLSQDSPDISIDGADDLIDLADIEIIDINLDGYADLVINSEGGFTNTFNKFTLIYGRPLFPAIWDWNSEVDYLMHEYNRDLQAKYIGEVDGVYGWDLFSVNTYRLSEKLMVHYNYDFTQKEITESTADIILLNDWNYWFGEVNFINDFNGDDIGDFTITINNFNIGPNMDSEWVVDLYNGSSGSSTVKDNPNAKMPTKFLVYPNFPNPFNSNTIITYKLPDKNMVELKIFDMIGNEVITLLQVEQVAGNHSVNWDGRNQNGEYVASGTYFYRLKIDDSVQSGKMIYIK